MTTTTPRPEIYSLRKAAQRVRPIPDGTVKVGRGTPWGNPFKLSNEGERESVITRFRAYALDRLEREPEWLEPLRGKSLACWCHPLACHADVLIAFSNAPRCQSCRRLIIDTYDVGGRVFCADHGYNPAEHYMSSMAEAAGVDW